MENWNEVKLTQILEESDFARVEQILLKKDSDEKWKELRGFLNSIKDKLLKRGILADFLYYALLSQFKYGQFAEGEHDNSE